MRGKEKRGALSYLKLLITVLKEQDRELDRLVNECVLNTPAKITSFAE